MNNDPYIYLLSSKTDYDRAKKSGSLIRESLNSEGFIHASPKEQLTRVANKHYKELEELLVLVVESETVTAEIRWEPAAGSMYPHIYGPLNTNAIVKTIPFHRDTEGRFHIIF